MCQWKKNITDKLFGSMGKKIDGIIQNIADWAYESENPFSFDTEEDYKESYNKNLYFKRKIVTHLGTWFKDGLLGSRVYFPSACERSIVYDNSEIDSKNFYINMLEKPIWKRTFWWTKEENPAYNEKEVHFDLFDNYLPYSENKDVCSISYFAELQLKVTLSNVLIFHVHRNDIFEEREVSILTSIFLIGIHEWIKKKKGKTVLLFLIYIEDGNDIWNKIENAQEKIDNFSKMNKIWDAEISIENIIKKIFPIWIRALDSVRMNLLTCPVQLEEIFEIRSEYMIIHDKKYIYQHTLMFEWRNKKHIYYNNLIKFTEIEPENLNNDINAKDVIEKGISDLSNGLIYFSSKFTKEQDIAQILGPYRLFQYIYLIKANSIELFKKWNNIVNNGKIIETFGRQSFDLFMQTFFLVENLASYEVNVEEAMYNLGDWIRLRIKRLFTKQMIILQEKALENFKDMLLDLIMDEKRDFDEEKNKLLDEVMSWFDKKSEIIKVEKLFDSLKAREELEKVLSDFSYKFKESPVVKLNSLDKIEKQTSNSNLKEKSMVIGFGLTTALRPKGFGNFQFVSHYSKGPHVFNFSLVNDRDFAEQEGQAKVKRLRVQPSVNFDIDL